MEGRVQYIFTLATPSMPLVCGTTEPELARIYNILHDGAKLLDTERVVVTAEEKVIFRKVFTVVDDAGMTIYDVYKNVLASYTVPERNGKRVRVLRWELWADTMEIGAESDDTAEEIMAKADKIVADGGFNVYDGALCDVGYEILEGEAK